MFNNLAQYVPEFDEAPIRAQLAEFTREKLLKRLIYAYKEKRVLARMLDELSAKFNSTHLVA